MHSALDTHNCGTYWSLLAIPVLAGAVGAVVGRRRYLGAYPRIEWVFKRIRDGLLVLAALLVVIDLVLSAAQVRCPG